MDIQDKERIKAGLDAYQDAVQGLLDLYNEFSSDDEDDLNNLQPLVDADGDKIHYGYIYPASLDEWVGHVGQFVEAFKQNLDKHCPDVCPFTYNILREQLGTKVGEYTVNSCSLSGSIGVEVRDHVINATPDWEDSFKLGELHVQAFQDGEMVYEKNYDFDYSLPLNDMVTKWKEIVLKNAVSLARHIKVAIG